MQLQDLARAFAMGQRAEARDNCRLNTLAGSVFTWAFRPERRAAAEPRVICNSDERPANLRGSATV